MKKVPLRESYFQGTVSVQRHSDGLQPWRLPWRELPLYRTFGELADRAMRCSGVRLSFETDSPVIEIEAEFPLYEENAKPLSVALTCGNRLLENKAITQIHERLRFETEGERMQEYALWLPVFSPMKIRHIWIEKGRTLRTVKDERLKWVTYGSSITNCRTSECPAETWPATAARALDLHLTSLGFGGECHLDSCVGRLIRDRPADIITLKLGINVYGAGSLGMRSFCSAAIGLVKLIREKHPETPIGLITPIYSCQRETTPNAVGMTLENYREQLRRAYESLCQCGDESLYLFEGTNLLGEADAHLLFDQLHPSSEGYKIMGQRAAEKILPTLLAARKG